MSGAVPVSAGAADDTGVAGVRFLVDGAALGAEDTAAPYTVSWNTTSAGDGPHTLTAVARDAAGNVAGSAPVTVTVANGSAPPASGRFEEGSATLAPSGAWTGTTSAGVGVTLSGDSAVYASAAGATARFTFAGTEVSWVGFRCERCGIARVSLDGALVATVDTYAPGRPAASGVLFGKSGLANGNHTLVVEVSGTANPASIGAYIVVDAFDVK